MSDIIDDLECINNRSPEERKQIGLNAVKIILNQKADIRQRDHDIWLLQRDRPFGAPSLETLRLRYNLEHWPNKK